MSYTAEVMMQEGESIGTAGSGLAKKNAMQSSLPNIDRTSTLEDIPEANDFVATRECSQTRTDK